MIQGYWWVHIDGTLHHQRNCVDRSPFDDPTISVEWWYVNDTKDWVRFQREYAKLIKKPLVLKKKEKDLLF